MQSLGSATCLRNTKQKVSQLVCAGLGLHSLIAESALVVLPLKSTVALYGYQR
jgi:hypothetical protein